ncbi:ribonuclease E inhibitor RraB [Microbulbifer pacificus]|uniref:ribonuclease E inhibitor RraB n=1 Tax=Microbulbifer pacificus TaxID=407164 RepID=UPI000CF4B4B4|nr:ribonuclease E inhibitor RraB [Microbulbifer pacificus]
MRKLVFTTIISFFSSLGIAEEFQPNTKGNRDVLNSLQKAGSNLSKLHPVEHHFYCYTYDCLAYIAGTGKTLGYEIRNVGKGEHQGVEYFYGDLVKETLLSLEKIDQENVIMLKIAEDAGAEYDGWGTPVVK